MKKLFLVDAYALIFRAYYAFIRRPMINSKGFETSAIFGFTKSLLELLKKDKPDHIAVAFDCGPTFRNDIYKEYKANRQQTPEVISQSSPIIKEIIKAMNIPVLEMTGYEADDIIGTLAKKAEQEGFTVYMFTPDKDFGQLVSNNIFMYKPKRMGNDNEILGVEEICKQYDIRTPEQVIDILALWGDASDNVPGVPGIGEKGASKLIQLYGSVEGVYENLHELKGKIKTSLEENKERAELAKKLVTICTDVPIEWNEESLKMEEPDKEKLMEIFSELEFFSFIKEMKLNASDIEQTPQKTTVKFEQGNLFDNAEMQTHQSSSGGLTINDVEHTYHFVKTDEQVDELIDLLSKQTEFCFDAETSGLVALDCKAVGLSFAIKPYEAWFVPIPQDPDKANILMEKFRGIFESEKIKKIGQNLKYDICVLKTYNIDVKGEMLDTMLMHYILDPESRHNMNYLSETLLGYSPIPIEELIGKKGAKQGTMAMLDPTLICNYAAEDADVTIRLKEKLYELLVSNNMLELYRTIEAPLIPVLADMEAAGVRIDILGLHELKKQFTSELIKIEDEVRIMAGVPDLNISSPKQLGVVLFEKLKIDENVKLTKTKQYSTSEETLVKLAHKHPIIDKILEYRSLKKLLSSYIESLPDLVNKRTGKIHTSFNQAVTATGRLSSNNPNLQNIPIREAKGREIRRAFIASDSEHLILSADYSQIELRLMAHMSQDPDLIDAFMQKQDIHTATAAKIFHVPLSAVTKEQRSKAKTANFGIIYGISAFGLSQRLNIPRGEAKELIDGYFAAYPKVRTYIDKVISEAQQNGYVSTLFGRKRWLRDINSGNATVRGNAERNAINAPIQGSAADIIKLAMINIQRKLKAGNFTSRMILQVHDELVFDVYKPELEQVREIVMHEMENAVSLVVPITAECGTGDNWLEAH